MAKQMISVKIDETLKDALIKIAELESRSQGGQIEFWIKKDAKRLKIEIKK